MTAVMPLTIDPDTLKALVGPGVTSPNPQLPPPRRRSVLSATRRGRRRITGTGRRITHKARRYGDRVEVAEPEKGACLS